MERSGVQIPTTEHFPQILRGTLWSRTEPLPSICRIRSFLIFQSDPGYVYDQVQGLMWTSEPITGNFTNPNCCGFDDPVKSPDGDGPYVEAAKSACGNMTYGIVSSLCFCFNSILHLSGGLKWRLPSRSELHRLMDHANVKPAINTYPSFPSLLLPSATSLPCPPFH